MKYGSACGFKNIALQSVGVRWVTLLMAVLLLLLPQLGCSGKKTAKSQGESAKDADRSISVERPVLLTRRGDMLIQVVEGEIQGHQIVRVRTVFEGKENIIIINIDQPSYELEIPLGPPQPPPPRPGAKGASKGGKPGQAGQGEDATNTPLDVYRVQEKDTLDKAQAAMVRGDYLAAMRSVDIVLRLNSNHIQARAMKGSIYYALGDNQLANNEWNRVLLMDPGNKEVQSFQDFLNRNPGGSPPPLPGAKNLPRAARPKAK